MVHSKVGYIGFAGGAILGILRSRYPEAYDVLEIAKGLVSVQ